MKYSTNYKYRLYIFLTNFFAIVSIKFDNFSPSKRLVLSDKFELSLESRVMPRCNLSCGIDWRMSWSTIGDVTTSIPETMFHSRCIFSDQRDMWIKIKLWRYQARGTTDVIQVKYSTSCDHMDKSWTNTQMQQAILSKSYKRKQCICLWEIVVGHIQ